MAATQRSEVVLAKRGAKWLGGVPVTFSIINRDVNLTEILPTVDRLQLKM